MQPKPLLWLNHFMTPVAIATSIERLPTYLFFTDLSGYVSEKQCMAPSRWIALFTSSVRFTHSGLTPFSLALSKIISREFKLCMSVATNRRQFIRSFFIHAVAIIKALRCRVEIVPNSAGYNLQTGYLEENKTCQHPSFYLKEQ